ncbi:MAG: hypothetical protein ACLPSF_08245 [Methylocella sp.]
MIKHTLRAFFTSGELKNARSKFKVNVVDPRASGGRHHDWGQLAEIDLPRASGLRGGSREFITEPTKRRLLRNWAVRAEAPRSRYISNRHSEELNDGPRLIAGQPIDIAANRY